MEEIFKQYGAAIITVLVVVGLIASIKLILGTGTTSIVYVQFTGLINSFYTAATAALSGI